jgi:hypothetical protein
MKLRAYGDSYTAGEGTSQNREKWKDNSWVKYLADMLNIEWVNNGISGNSNLKIFNKVVEDLKDGVIEKGDFITIMWSSSLRDVVAFLPKNEWVSWSTKHLLEFPHKFIESYKSESEEYNQFLFSFKELFVTKLYNQNYYNIVNQNYIIFLQKMFEFYGVKYLMCDGFESMIIDLNEEDNRLDLINTKFYWRFNNQTFRDLLNDTNRIDIWEHQDINFKSRPTQHPNAEGYRIIASELYEVVIKYI